MKVDATRWQLAGDTERYMLGCSNFLLKVIESRSLGVRRTVAGYSCKMSTRRALGHPCDGCARWKKDRHSVDCPDCGLGLTYKFVNQAYMSSKTTD